MRSYTRIEKGEKRLDMRRVYISFSPDCSVTYCFWNYFFQACGISVIEKKIDEKWKLDNSKVPQLVICKHADLQQNDKGNSKNIVYCFKDIPEEKSGNNVEDYYRSIINVLFEEDEEKEILYILLCIFGGIGNAGQASGAWQPIPGSLWSASWLFHEIAQTNEGRWDKEIYQKCWEVLEMLEQKKADLEKSWNYKFLRLYCEYIQCGVRGRNFTARAQGCKQLLDKCREFAKEQGWLPQLCVLTGKICNLSSTENKYAVSYYNRAVSSEKKPSIYYDIGHVYEKAYGDMDRAMEYYRKAYMSDNQYFRALYKIAVQHEGRGEWKEAVTSYSRVRCIIGKERAEDSISVCDLEYDYKTCRKIMLLCKKNISDEEVFVHYQNEIRQMHDHIEKYVDYSSLTKRMFSGNESQKKRREIMDELYKKLDTECCK